MGTAQSFLKAVLGGDSAPEAGCRVLPVAQVMLAAQSAASQGLFA